MDSFKEDFDRSAALLSRGEVEEARRICEKLLRTEEAPGRRALLLQRLGRCLHMIQRSGEAVPLLREALELLKQHFGAGHPATLNVRQDLSFLLQATGEYEESILQGRMVLETLLDTLGEENHAVADAMISLSASYYERGDMDEARHLSLRARTILEKIDPRGFSMSTCLNNLGRIAENREDYETGCALHREAVALRRELCGESADLAFCLGNLGTALLSAGHPAEAAEALDEALRLYVRAGRTEGPSIEGLRHNLALCRRMTN